MNAELTHHLGYEKHDPAGYNSGNSRKGTSGKTVKGVDEAHKTLSGPATQKILQREFHDYGDERYRRLAEISGPHIYNLRTEDRGTAAAGPARAAGVPAG